MIDALFVHPNASRKIYQDLSKDFSAIEPPIWAGMLAQHCRDKGFKVQILDCEAMQYDDDQAAHVIASMKPRVACFVVYGQQPSASTQNMEGATSLSKRLRELHPQIKILFVGGHVSALPVETMNKHPEIDFCCTNEGVYTISELLATDLEAAKISVKGLVFRWEDAKIQTVPMPVVPKERLHFDLPGIAWDLLPIKKYRTALWHSYTNGCDRGNFASIYTSLGCPYSCSFCCINAPFDKRQFRFWSPNKMFYHFDTLANAGVKNLKIADEMFVLNPEHFMNICKILIEGHYNFNIWCYARIDTIKPDYLEIMKKAGINWVGLGIESGVKKVRSDVVKGRFEEVDIRQVVGMVRGSGINVAANYIFGLPEDTFDSMQQTFDLALELNTPMANFYSCMAYPGSPLYNQAVANGLKLPDSYAGFSQHSYECQPLPTRYLSAEQVLKFRDFAWRKYHSEPDFQNMIKENFGDAAVDQINDSLKIKLKRKILGD